LETLWSLAFEMLHRKANVSVLMVILHAFFFLQDLKDAKSIVDWIAWAEPQYNFSPMIDEWCKEAPQELDFNHEAGKLCLLQYFC
jgi:hypothetical protein